MSNKELQPHEQRVVEEKDQLKERLDKLRDFLQKEQPTFIDDKNWTLLSEQYDAMNWYYTLLVSRIELF
ncbi:MULTISPECIES: hypothetical protein [unclassified Acinetobacter]|uniref:crAss001_48 related protein n=1 Tax=unclassified Acinetobacter TaxID=196816 RepID=UPI0015D2E2F2|nr:MULTISPECIES: hypothetical protein [unclassified Acinetobacter]